MRTSRSSRTLSRPTPQPQLKPQSRLTRTSTAGPRARSPPSLSPRRHPRQFFYCSASDGTNVVAAFEAAIAKAIDYSKKPPEDFVDQASLAPRAPPPAHLTHAQAQASPLPRPQPL